MKEIGQRIFLNPWNQNEILFIYFLDEQFHLKNLTDKDTEENAEIILQVTKAKSISLAEKWGNPVLFSNVGLLLLIIL